MPNLPVSIENDVALQNNTTGEVDFLQFQGNTLTGSALFDYGIAGMNIVCSGRILNSPLGLVAQNPTTGVVDFLGLNGSGNLVSSAMTSVSLPPIVGEGVFGTTVPGQAGFLEFVSQLPDGELDMLAFDSSGTLIASDLVANSIGLPHVVGVAAADNGNGGSPLPAFAGVGTSQNSDVVAQFADGSLDIIGLSGDFAAGTLSVVGTFLLPGSAGTAPVGAVNQDTRFSNADGNINSTNALGGLQGFEAVSQLASGQLDLQMFDSGYNDLANEGVLYASNLLNPSFLGFHVVDAGLVTRAIFPIT